MRRLQARELAIRAVLRQARIQAGLSQRALSTRLREPTNWIGRIESLARGVSLAEFLAISKALKRDPHELIDDILKGQRPADSKRRTGRT